MNRVQTFSSSMRYRVPGTFRVRQGLALLAIGAMACGMAACSTAKSTASTSAGSSGASSSSCPQGNGDIPADAVAAVKAAEQSAAPWAGPSSSPKGVKNKLIVDVSQDQTNAGNNGVAAGLQEAARKLGWQFKQLNGGGQLTGMVSALHQAIALKPAGIALQSVPTEGTLPVLQEAAADGIAIVGWHVSNTPGKIAGTPLFWNVSTKPFDIAKISGQYAVVTSCGKAHAIELTDMTYPIDQEKDAGFQAAFKSSSTSSVEIDDYPFGSRSTRTSGEITANITKNKNINWFVTINDDYFDYSIPALRAAGLSQNGPVLLNSAGDGSPNAFQRIRQGNFQVVTVPEPLNLQGWIMADEFNRAFSKVEPFDFVTQPHLTVKSNVDLDGGKDNVYDPDNGYRNHFAQLWGLTS